MPRRRSSYANYYWDFEPGHTIETDEGIKARSQQGEFSKNWWAKKWISALERLMDTGRLGRGRTYARKGQVLSIKEAKNGIEARVQGSRPQPYKVSIHLAPLNDGQWELAIDSLAEQAIFTAQLLAGEMPPDIEQAFKRAGVSLFPSSDRDLWTHCSCPDWANPCKHVAAAHYILGDRFDEDPFLLFRLRGRDQEEILEGLRQRRTAELPGGQEEDDEIGACPALEDCLQDFWTSSEGLEGLTAAPRPAEVEMPLLQRLGDPDFVPPPGLKALLSPAYQAISASAIRLAFEDTGD